MSKRLRWGIPLFVFLLVAIGIFITTRNDRTANTQTTEVAFAIEDGGITTTDALEGQETVEAKIHIVQKGDWLSRICPTDWKNVATINGIENPNLIYPGQELQLTDQCSDGSVIDDMVVAEVIGNEELAIVKKDGQYALAPLVSGNTVKDKISLWKSYGSNPLSCNVAAEDALKMFTNLSDASRAQFLKMHADGIGTIVHMERGMEIGDMLGGHGKTYYNTKVDFIPKASDVMIVYVLNRTETDAHGLKVDVKETLSMPTSCCNWALKVERIPRTPEVPVKQPPVRESPPGPPIVEIPPENVPIPCTGTCVPQSRPPDCAMSGCVSRVPLPDAMPTCAASCESALNPNSDPPRERRVIACGNECPMDGPHPKRIAQATFTVLGGAMILPGTPEEICRQTPDVEYRGLQIVCLPDGTVWRGE